MSIMDEAPRSPETVREEIGDLKSYLTGLPSEWRASGAFFAYEERLRVLDHELALAQINDFASHLLVASSSGSHFEVAKETSTQARLLAILRNSEREYMELAEFRARESQWLTYVALFASSAAVASALASVSILILPGALTAAGTAAVMAFCRFSERSREAAKRADYLKALQNEIVHFPDVSESAAFQASARVEALISSVLSKDFGERIHK